MSCIDGDLILARGDQQSPGHEQLQPGSNLQYAIFERQAQEWTRT